MRIFICVIGILCLLLSVALFYGKGAFLIAGYNTMSEKEKAKVDTRKLTRIFAVIVFIAAITFLMAAFGSRYTGYAAIILMAFTLGFIVFGQRYILNDIGKREYDHKSHTLYKVIGLFIIIAVVIATYRLLFTGEIKITIKEDAIVFAGGSYDMSVNTAKIDAYYINDDVDHGRKTNGFDNMKIRAGHFANDEFGNYYLYAYTECEAYLVMKCGKIYIVYGDTLAKVNDLADYLAGIEER